MGEADDSGGAGGPASAGRMTDPEAGMSEKTASATTPAEHPAAEAASPDDESLVAEELLVEEVSIDGMCGVY
jgi:mycofactocin precursor